MPATILVVHSALLAWSANSQSPTIDEVAHLPAGVSHWQLGDFTLYSVNPPLVRMTAALPILALQPKTDWLNIYDGELMRPEFRIGHDFARNNSKDVALYFSLARWACIPFSVLGGFVCFRWASDLFDWYSGMAALCLWCFCPTILAHGQLITPDVASGSLLVLFFYLLHRWRSWQCLKSGALLGLSLGAALLTKTTLWVFLPLIPLYLYVPGLVGTSAGLFRAALRSSLHVLVVFVIALFTVNCVYGFRGTFTKLADYPFYSTMLNGNRTLQSEPGNRFKNSLLGQVRVPLPYALVVGVDTQRVDFESSRWSYLRGEFRQQGWWYYYLYAFGVKTPTGTLLLLAASIVLWGRLRQVAGAEAALLGPPMVIVALVSSQIGLNHHLRYIIPAFPFIYISISRLFIRFAGRPYWIQGLLGACLALSIASSIAYLPYSLSYFNEMAGGPEAGPRHLLDSNVDWGQDLYRLKRWAHLHPEAQPLYVAYFGIVDPSDAGVPCKVLSIYPTEDNIEGAIATSDWETGWYAISVNCLQGYVPGGRGRSRTFEAFRKVAPVDRAGYSILIFQVTSPVDSKGVNTCKVP